MPGDAGVSLARVSTFAIRCRHLPSGRFGLSHTRVQMPHEPPFQSIGRRLFRIACPFVAIVALLVLLATESISIVSASRAYVGAESLWSKAQKEAVYSLYRYAQSGSEFDFQGYRDAISIPVGDRRARLELEKTQPDVAVAGEGFIAGHNDPEDVDGMIALFRRFRTVSFMSNAIAVWSQADDLIAELDTLADELHARIRLEGVGTVQIDPILARIFEVNQALTPLEVMFSNSLGEVSRRTERILVAALTVVASLLVVLGIAITWKILRASSELERQLFAERDRARVTLESIGDAVITTDARGNVVYLNPVAEGLTSAPAAWAQGMPLDAVLRIVREASPETALNPVARLADAGPPETLAGDTLLVRPNGEQMAVDVSVAPIHDRTKSVTGAVLVLKDVTRERAHAAQLIHQARHDALTGLVNRREFEQRLSHALASAADLDRRHAVLYMDLDNFKDVNDSAGHAAGDALLRGVTGSLAAVLRDRDTLARVGGDEFAVLLENCTLDDAMRIAEKLRQAVAEFEFKWETQSFPIGVSIGVVQVAGRRSSVADVLRAADASCYAAKHAGRNRVHLHDPPIGLANERR